MTRHAEMITLSDLASNKWARGVFSIKGEMRHVRFVPGCRNKVGCLIEGTKNFIYWDATRKRWVEVPHGIIRLYSVFGHMIKTHARELPCLEIVKAVCKDLHIEFSLLNPGNVDSAWAAYLSATTMEQVGELGRPIDLSKRKAKGQLIFMIKLRDSRGRVNIGVLRCRGYTAIEALEERVKAIRGMSPWIQFYRQQIMIIIGLLLNSLRKLREMYSELWRMIHQNPLDKFKIDSYLRNILREISYLSGIKPFARLARHLDEEARQIRVEIRKSTDADKLLLERLIRNGIGSTSIFMTARFPIERAKHVLTNCLRRKNVDKEMIKKLLRDLRRVLADVKEAKDFDFEKPIKNDLTARLEEVLGVLDVSELNATEVRLAHKILDRALACL